MARNKMMLSLFPDVFEFNEELSNEQMGILLRAAAAYRFYGEVYTGDDPIIRMGFKVLASQIDRYTEYCDGKREAMQTYVKKKKEQSQTVPQVTIAHQKIPQDTIQDHGGPKATSISVSPSVSSSISESISSSSSVSLTEKERENTSFFISPDKQEVKDYCTEEGLEVDPEYFVSYYDSVGWQMGNHPMQDWKAAVRLWDLRARKENPDGKNKLEPAFHIGTVL